MTGGEGSDGLIRAPIARGRVAEMLRKGWVVVGELGEDRVDMAGPDPDGEWTAIGSALEPIFARVSLGRDRLAA